MTTYPGCLPPHLAAPLPAQADAPPHWRLGRHSILVRSAYVLMASFLLAGALALSTTLMAIDRHQQERADERLGQLLDTVENSAALACLGKDAQLAGEIAHGLLRHPSILAVTIRADGVELANAAQAAALPGAPGRNTHLTRPLRAGGSGRPAGEIAVVVDTGAIAQAGQAEARFVLLQILGLLALIAVTVLAVMLVFIVRPIKAMSDGLHRLDATKGERLKVPKSHAGSELGRLVQDINRLAGSLADALDQERSLRLEKEVDEKKYHSIFEHAETGIFIAAPDGTLSSWNPAFARLMDIPPHSAAGGGCLNLRRLAWQDPAGITELTLLSWLNNQSLADDLSVRLDSGIWRWLNVVLTPIGDDQLQGVVHDVTELKEAEACARRLAVTDRLTGVSNRLGLEEKLQRRLADPLLGQVGTALILVDLDNFRRINEGFGLPSGDAILKEASVRLGDGIGDGGSLARLAADRFALTLDASRGCNPATTSAHILQALARPFYLDGSPVHLHASLGIACHPRDGTDLPALLRCAELALDGAKRSGGNRYVFFDAALAEAAEQRRRLEDDLRRASRDLAFQLYLQPIVDLAGNRLAGAEALIRWPHPEHGLIGPDAFIALAEEIGLIDRIGLWTVDTACRQLACWHEAGIERHLSVNVSARQIPDGLPPFLLSETVKRHGVRPANLALEITEGVLLADIERSLDWIQAVQAMGFRVYLDDFGTGYSALSYLKRYPIDTLKIDRSFVHDMDDDSSDRALVAAVIAMAGSLDMEVVAEGVETDGQMQILRGLNCRYAQGYHFSPPVHADQFEAAAARIDAMLHAEPLAA